MSNNNNSTSGFLVGVLVIVALLAYSTKHKQPKTVIDSQAIIREAEVNGVRYSSTMARLRADIQKLQDDGIVELSINNGKLSNPILGQTSIIINSDNKIEASIVIDVEDAVRAGDRVEPLLGHELKHVWDALFLYDKTDNYVSVSKFIATANNEKTKLYRDREVESSAIGIEDSIRHELVSSKNDIFKHLPKTRQEADVLYAERSKIDPTLKSVLQK
jgi:hypothetical protein